MIDLLHRRIDDEAAADQDDVVQAALPRADRRAGQLAIREPDLVERTLRAGGSRIEQTILIRSLNLVYQFIPVGSAGSSALEICWSHYLGEEPSAYLIHTYLSRSGEN